LIAQGNWGRAAREDAAGAQRGWGMRLLGIVAALVVGIAVFASPALATAPNQPQLDNNTVQENQPVGTVVGTLSSSDPDGGTTFTYQLVAGTGDTDNGKFKIVGDKLTTKVVFDYETQPSASVRVRVTDAQGETNRSVFTIQITNDTSDDTGHGPTNINLSNHDVAENQPAETVVGTLTATDPDAGETFTYKMSAGGTGAADNTKFHIVGDQLKTKQPLDYESQSTLAIRISVTDSQGNQFAKRFTITVTDNNDAPTDITFSNLSVPENSASGTTVGTASTTDQDAADTFTYSLVSGTGDTDNASFTMDGATLKTAASFDFETKNQYSIRVQTDDGHGGTFQKAFTVQVTDVTENSAPTNLSLSPSSVAENQPSGTEVGTLTSTDPDAGDTFTYSLVTGTGDTDNGSFTIAGDKLKTAAVFDYEAKNSYTVRVQTDDGHGHTFQKQLTVTVTDVQENVAPTDITFSNLSVAENQPSGTTVGTASSTDANAGDTFTYTLVTGTGDTDNGSFTFSGADLKTAATFDFEAVKNQYSIRVQTDDGHGGTFQKAFTVTVTNVNEAPADIALSKSDIDENQASGTTVGTLSATDADAGDTHTFSLVTGTGDTDNASFTISGSSLKTAASFNYEAKNSYSIRVRATDSGNLTFDKVFTITINNVNEAPTGVTDSYSGAVGNTEFALGTSPSGPKITGSGANPKANDTDPEGDTISCVAETVSSTGGGSAIINSDCTYTFRPGVGDKSQTDSFTYHPSDGTLNGSGTIQVAIGSSLVWYVDRDAASNGDGRSHNPLQNLAGINGAGGSGDSDTTNEIIFLYSSATAYTGGLPLESGQQLIGEPQGLVVNATTLVAAGGSNPNVQNSGGTAITLAEGNILRRVNVNSASGDGISGTNINAADIGGSSTISGVTGADFKLSGGGGTIAFGPSITNTAGRSIDIQNRTSGTTTISGTINDTGTGIILNQNSGGSLTNFTNTLALSTGANPAFTATGSGTVTATGTGSTLTTTTGRALNVTNLIGAADLTFQAISANGAANGIFLSATGSAGGLHVTGNGTAGSGGTIQNTTGADNTTDGIGVYLNDTDDVSLNWMSIHDHSNYAIKGASVIGFTLADSTVNGTNGTLSNVDDAVLFNNLTGTATFPRDTISGGFFDNLEIVNTTGTLNLTVGGDNAADKTTIGLNQTNGGDGIYLESNGAAATITAKVKNDTFSGAASDMLQSAANNSGTVNLTLSSNAMNNTHSNTASGGGGVVVSASNGTMNATITGNTITGAKGASLATFADLANGVWNGTISGNNLGNANAGSGGASGIDMDANQGGTVTANIATNTIQHFKENGMRVITGDCTPNNVPSLCGNAALFNVTIQGNTLSNRDAATAGSNWNGILAQASKGSTDNITACFDIKNNSLAGQGTGPNAGLNSDLRVRQRFLSTVKLPGYTGANTDTAAVQSYLTTRPNTFTTVQATQEVAAGGGGFTNTSPAGSACTQPTF
jgi:Cadherin domain/Bacterial Ig domain